MIELLTAFTSEIDDVDQAVSEVCGQINVDCLRQHSIGIISCYHEFYETGVVQGIDAQFSFDVVGMNCKACMTNGAGGQLTLVFLVLTSDEVCFKTGLTAPLTKDVALSDAFGDAGKQIKPLTEQQASFMFVAGPMVPTYNGDDILREVGNVFGPIPVFGGLAIEEGQDGFFSKLYYGGVEYADRAVLVVAYGGELPVFLTEGVRKEYILNQRAVVTKSAQNIIMELNGMTACEYLASIGLMDEALASGGYSMPMLMDYQEGVHPTVRSILGLLPEGYIVCGGDMPVGTTIAFAVSGVEDILQSAEALSEEVLEVANGKAVLVFSCFGRFSTLGIEPDLEMDKLAEKFAGKISFTVVYSGGEFCPVRDADGKYENRYHNYSLAACILQGGTT